MNSTEVTINHTSGAKTVVCSYEYMGYEDRPIGYVYEVFLYSPDGSERFMGSTHNARNVWDMVEASMKVLN